MARYCSGQRTWLRLVRSRVYYIYAAGGDCCIVNCVVIYGFHAWTRLRPPATAQLPRRAGSNGWRRPAGRPVWPGAGLHDRSTRWVIYQHAAMTTHAVDEWRTTRAVRQRNKNSTNQPRTSHHSAPVFISSNVTDNKLHSTGIHRRRKKRRPVKMRCRGNGDRLWS